MQKMLTAFFLAGFEREVVDQSGAVARSMALKDQRPTVPPDSVQLGMVLFAEQIPDTVLQVFAGHWEIMNARQKSQFLQRFFNGCVGDKKGARGWDFKMLSDGVTVNQAIRKSGTAFPYFPGKLRADVRIDFVIVFAMIAGMPKPQNPVEAVRQERAKAHSHRINRADRAAQDQAVCSVMVRRELKVGRG